MHLLFLLAVITLTLTSCEGSGSGATASPTGAAVDDAGDTPVIVAARVVCRLVADNASAAAATITGADGTQSALVDGTAYWFFGDTVRTGPGGRADVIPAAVATSSDDDGSDCIDLTFKTSNGIAEPMLPRGDETTAWPDGVLPLDDGSILFYMVKAYRQSPFAWHVGSVGLGRIPPESTNAVRVSEKIWDDQSGFGARVTGVRSPILDGEDVFAYLRTDDGKNFAVRAPLDRIDDLAAYTYWTGAAWSGSPGEAQPLWQDEASTLPADNGVQVTFDEQSQRWLAIYNGHLSSISARTAPEPWGPWSAPVTWVDCRKFVEDVYPYCYSAELHRHLTRDDGGTLYVSVSSQRPYDVALLELHRASAIREWRDASDNLLYAAASPGDGYEDGGIAFYASDDEAPGLAPVYELRDGNGRVTYSLAASGGAQPTFYAHADRGDGPVPTRPVYRWQRDGIEALSSDELDGWRRGDVAFYVPCTLPLSEISGCER
jgi:hypothetical protein